MQNQTTELHLHMYTSIHENIRVSCAYSLVLCLILKHHLIG